MKNNILVYVVSVILAFVLGIIFSHGIGGRWHRGIPYDRGYGYGMNWGREFNFSYGIHRMDILKEELGLTDKQVKQIFDIGTEYRAKYFENRSNSAKLTELHESHKKAVEGILTKDQLEKFKKLKNEFGYGRQWKGSPYRDCPNFR